MADSNIPRTFKSEQKMQITGEISQDAADRAADSWNEDRRLLSRSGAFLICCAGIAVVLLAMGYACQ